MTEVEITALFDEWNNALQTRDPEQVTNLYVGNPILLPTVFNWVRHTHEEVKDYFAHFLEKNPVETIDESNIHSISQLAINSDIYTFTFHNGTSVQARFTFVYCKDGGRWRITEHHSSQMPE